MIIRFYTIFFLLVSPFIFSQNKTKTYEQKTDSILSAYKDVNKLDSLVFVAHEATLYFNKKKQYKKAIYYALKEVHIGKAILSKKKYKNAISNLAFFYLKNEDFLKSIAYYKKVIDSFPLSKKTYSAYCEIGRNYKRMDDYYKALLFYKKGLSQPDSLTPQNHFVQLINLTTLYTKIDANANTKEQYLSLQKTDSIFSIYKFNDSKYYSLQNQSSLGLSLTHSNVLYLQF